MSNVTESDVAKACAMVDACRFSEAMGGRWPDLTRDVAQALADEREACAHTCELMVVGGRAWTEGQAAAADVLQAAARNIRARDTK